MKFPVEQMPGPTPSRSGPLGYEKTGADAYQSQAAVPSRGHTVWVPFGCFDERDVSLILQATQARISCWYDFGSGLGIPCGRAVFAMGKSDHPFRAEQTQIAD